MSVYDCEVLELPKINTGRTGAITTFESNLSIPFAISRIFYLYDLPSGACRGAHAHKECIQLLIAASGSFDVMLDDGYNKRIVHLNKPHQGLVVQPGIWASEVNFSSGAICLVLASHFYEESDYIRNYEDYLTYVQ